ncbi:MAG: 4-hydroxy-tetrahydrodipicolinate reductase [Candidatus Omnitrophica bacterium]|nr:4-hydroxy-tetrahydrodipicolinate reductase [Candidatus Omnitrophota bacterium]
MVKLGISGARGKMGERIIALAKESGDFQIIFGLERLDHPDIGKNINGVPIVESRDYIQQCDCLIDFSAAKAITDNLSYLTEFKKSAVIGITGLDSSSQEKIKSAAKNIPIVFSPNMSVGVNILFRLLKEAAKSLAGYQASIFEAHHIHKKDSPSGTAKKIAEIINGYDFNIKVEDIEAKREDEIVGDHKVVFESDLDKLELSHSAKTRDIFVQGALVAASWVKGKPAGLYSMEDVLGK